MKKLRSKQKAELFPVKQLLFNNYLDMDVKTQVKCGYRRSSMLLQGQNTKTFQRTKC